MQKDAGMCGQAVDDLVKRLRARTERVWVDPGDTAGEWREDELCQAAADRIEVLERLYDRNYLAGFADGWNAARAPNPEQELRRIHNSRQPAIRALKEKGDV